MWDARTGEEITTLNGHTSGFIDACFSPDGNRIASVSYDKAINLWDAFTAIKIATLTGHSDRVTGVCFSPDASRIIANCSPAPVFAWDSASFDAVPIDKTDIDMSSRFASPDGQWLLYPRGDSVLVVDLDFKHQADEKAYRQLKTTRDPNWHARQADIAKEKRNLYSEMFHRAWAIGPSQSPAILSRYQNHELFRPFIGFDLTGEQVLYWTNQDQGTVFAFGLSSRRLRYFPQRDLLSPRGVLVDSGARASFFADYGREVIVRAMLDGSRPQVIIQNAKGVRGIAIDNQNSKLYWTDRDGKQLKRSNLDGSDVEILKKRLDYPYSVVIDKSAARVFVQDISEGAIYKCNLDGTDFRLFVKTNGGPSSMGLDLQAKNLYYTDGSPGNPQWQDEIKRISVQGGKQETVLNKLEEPRLVVDSAKRTLYFATKLSSGAYEIRSANLDIIGSEKLSSKLIKTVSDVRAMAIYDPAESF